MRSAISKRCWKWARRRELDTKPQLACDNTSPSRRLQKWLERFRTLEPVLARKYLRFTNSEEAFQSLEGKVTGARNCNLDQTKTNSFTMTSEGGKSLLGDSLPQSNTTSNGSATGGINTNDSTEQVSDKKRVRTGSQDVEMAESPVKRQKGVAPIKAE